VLLINDDTVDKFEIFLNRAVNREKSLVKKKGLEDLSKTTAGSVSSVLKPSRDRIIRAKRIVRKPEQYKICCGCDSIVVKIIKKKKEEKENEKENEKELVICPNCHHYRFEEDEALIVAQAKLLVRKLPQSPEYDD